VVLVTLTGCHLLDGLVVVSVEACKKLVRCSREELCEGHCTRPAGATKSNSSKSVSLSYPHLWVGSCGA
jgi:hypothetical protein